MTRLVFGVTEDIASTSVAADCKFVNDTEASSVELNTMTRGAAESVAEARASVVDGVMVNLTVPAAATYLSEKTILKSTPMLPPATGFVTTGGSVKPSQ